MNDESATLELRDAAVPDHLLPGHDLAWWWLVAVLFLLILIPLIIVWRVRGRAKPPTPAMIRETAYREALAALDGQSPADARAAAVLSSMAVRKYLSIATADPALFETQEEFISRHDALSAFRPEARAAAASALSRLAELKYAPQPPEAPAAVVISESRALLETLHHGYAA